MTFFFAEEEVCARALPYVSPARIAIRAHPATRRARFDISSSFSRLRGRPEGRSVNAQRSGVGVERGRDPEWQRRQVLAVAQWQLVQDGDAKGFQALLQDVLDRLGPVPLGSLLPPVAFLHVPDDHAGHAVELPGLCQLDQVPVDVPGRRVEVLE